MNQLCYQQTTYSSRVACHPSSHLFLLCGQLPAIFPPTHALLLSTIKQDFPCSINLIQNTGLLGMLLFSSNHGRGVGILLHLNVFLPVRLSWPPHGHEGGTGGAGQLLLLELAISSCWSQLRLLLLRVSMGGNAPCASGHSNTHRKAATAVCLKNEAMFYNLQVHYNDSD
jgi:hypothetical protein